MDTLLQDVRFGVRRLLHDRGIALAAVLSLALGIGANTTIFSAVNALLLRPFDIPAPERVIAVAGALEGRGSGWSISWPDVDDYRRRNRTFTEVVALRQTGYALDAGGDRPERVSGIDATEAIFPVLGVTPALGRAFTAREASPQGERVLVLMHDLWARRFAADPRVLGRRVRLAGSEYTIVGVMPKGFAVPGATVDVIAPLRADATTWNRASGGLQALGRLRPGATLEDARRDLVAIAAQIARDHPGSNTGRSVELTELAASIYGPQLRTALWVLLGAVGLVLLIACTNIANVLLARSIAREREMAIRAAIGAGRGRVVRLLLTESMLLAVAGGIAGCIVAFWGIVLLKGMVPDGTIARLDEVRLDGRVLGFAIGLTALTGVVFGLAPAMHAAGVQLTGMLRDGARGASGGARRGRLRAALVVAEVSLAIVLLVGAGLMIRTLAGMFAVDPGFAAERVLTFQLSLDARYQSPTQVAAFQQQALERLAALPGVEAAGIADALPMSGNDNFNDFMIEGRPAPTPADVPNAGNVMVTPGYFRAMGVALLQGRDVAPSDAAGAPGVAVVNRAFARKYWPGESAIGRRIRANFEREYRTVVGVVADVRHRGLDQDARPEFYVPYAQLPWAYRSMTFAVRGRGEPTALANAAQGAVLAVDPGQPVYDLAPMRALVQSAVGFRRLFTLLLAVFGGVALLLAAIGVYGVVSYGVAQRTREIGIRAALGAARGDILALVVRQGLAMVALGLVLGLAGALASSRLLASQLFGVGATDPLTFAVAALVLLGVALVASVIPARRATRIAPLEALRYE